MRFGRKETKAKTKKSIKEIKGNSLLFTTLLKLIND